VIEILALHMECLLHYNCIVAFEQMPIVGNIAKSIHRFTGVPGGMEHGQCAIRWLPLRAGRDS
jgi:hypothetical protein